MLNDNIYYAGYNLKKIGIQWRLFKGNIECFPRLFYATQTACLMAIDYAPEDPSKLKAYWEEKVELCKQYDHIVCVQKDTH